MDRAGTNNDKQEVHSSIAQAYSFILKVVSSEKCTSKRTKKHNDLVTSVGLIIFVVANFMFQT